MNQKEKNEICIWIARFTDGTLASCYGTRKKAEAIAEEKKELYGGSYIIV